MIKLTIIAIATILGIGFTTCSAQQYAAKAYLNVSNSSFKPYIYTRYQNQNQTYNTTGYIKDYIHPSVAINYKNKRKNQHEVELNRGSISNTDFYIEKNTPTGGITSFRSQSLTTTIVRLRYEYILSFNKKPSAKIEPSIGFGTLAYYERVKATPYESSNFSTSATYFGSRFIVTPRVCLNITKRVFADINIPICIMDAGIAKQNIANPTLPTRAQRYSIADVELFPSYFSLRIGAGVRI
jgi:hypothetical protein